MLSDKYIAGFLDADGYVGLQWRNIDRADSNPEKKKGLPVVSFSQSRRKDKVLYLIQESIGGTMKERENTQCSVLTLEGKKALKLLGRVRKHLVIKRHMASVVEEMAFKSWNRKEASAYLKEQRRVPSLPKPNFPPRKWLAGYFDGDGSFQTRKSKNRTSAQPTASIVASDYDSEGIETIQKAFGGSMQKTGKENHLVRWTLTMPPSKAKQFLEYFAKHLVVKQDEAYLILGCAEMGHYHDGNGIKSALKHLKAQPHRLNEQGVSASELLSGIKDIKTRRQHYKDLWKENGGCLECGANTYYSDGVCKKCYDWLRNNKPKRQSIQVTT